jgi:hypothetical protein
MNDVMADLASDAVELYGILFTTDWWWCWWSFGHCGSGASNIVGLTPLSHCVLWSKQLTHLQYKLLWLVFLSVRLVLLEFTKSSTFIVWKILSMLSIFYSFAISLFHYVHDENLINYKRSILISTHINNNCLSS